VFARDQDFVGAAAHASCEPMHLVSQVALDVMMYAMAMPICRTQHALDASAAAGLLSLGVKRREVLGGCIAEVEKTAPADS
jgi:hypothetical protein